ncbi:TPA: hypothetical protein ACH3X2_005340 [Trebouxia sp. C0005]
MLTKSHRLLCALQHQLLLAIQIRARSRGCIVTLYPKQRCCTSLLGRKPVVPSRLQRIFAHYQSRPVHTTAVPGQQEGQDTEFMAAALHQAQLAAQQQEVPVGAVLVCGGKIITQAFNQTEKSGNPTAHAEMLCIQQAAAKLGADGSWISLLPRHNPDDSNLATVPSKPHPFHDKMQVRRGVLAHECGNIMKQFFKERRQALHMSSEPGI